MNDNVNKIIDFKESKKYIDKTMKIVVPMAGTGSRFQKAGYTDIKPLMAN